jgi:hypothetical protein
MEDNCYDMNYFNTIMCSLLCYFMSYMFLYLLE